MSITMGPIYSNISQVRGPSGFYNIKIDSGYITVYVNQEYDGGGWALVLANRKDTAGMNNLTYTDAVNSCNYRTDGTSNGTNTVVNPLSATSDLSKYNIWIGTSYWSQLAGRVTSNKIMVVQFVAPTDGTALNGSHSKRYRWRFDNFNGTYGIVGATSIADETATGAPGFYNYHAANGFSLTTYDNDQDVYIPTNCSSYYNNNPWWYGECWSGHYFAGGGYQDQPNWIGAGSDIYQYGAVYIK